MPHDGEYYRRATTTHLDGSPIFATPEDAANQRSVASRLEQAWGCTIHDFGRLAVIDYYAVRDGRLVGLLEVKARSHASTRFPTVFLNLRKWTALMLGAVGHGVPALFVVSFTDAIYWIRVGDIDARRFEMGGCSRQVKSRSDVEPVITVPIAEMCLLDTVGPSAVV